MRLAVQIIATVRVPNSRCPPFCKREAPLTLACAIPGHFCKRLELRCPCLLRKATQLELHGSVASKISLDLLLKYARILHEISHLLHDIMQSVHEHCLVELRELLHPDVLCIQFHNACFHPPEPPELRYDRSELVLVNVSACSFTQGGAHSRSSIEPGHGIFVVTCCRLASFAFETAKVQGDTCLSS